MLPKKMVLPWLIRAAPALMALLICGGPAFAQLQITTTDGRTAEGTLAGVGADGVLRWRTATSVVSIPVATAVSIEARGAQDAIPRDGLRLDLFNGDELYGRLDGGSGDDVRVAGSCAGAVTVPLDLLSALWNVEFKRDRETLPPTDRNGEALFIDRDGRIDAIPGTLDRITKSEVVFSSPAGAGRAFAFGRDRVVAIRLAAEHPASRPATGTRCTVRAIDGSRLTGRPRASEGAALKLHLDVGLDVTIDAATIRTVTFAGDALMHLSDREPVSLEETPLLAGGTRHGLLRDTSGPRRVPFSIGRETFAKAVALSAKTRATWALDGSVSRFFARVGVDPSTRGRALPGSARASIEIDGKVSWKSDLLSAGQDAVVVDLKGLSGAHTLSLVVDFGESFDSGARVIFGGAMLLR